MTPDNHAIAVMILTLLALVLFTRDRIPLQTSSLIVLCLLTVGFTWFPYEYEAGRFVEPYSFFSGFANNALIAVCALMVIGTGLVKTGALEPIGDWLARSWKEHPTRSFLATLALTALLSAFINNTPLLYY